MRQITRFGVAIILISLASCKKDENLAGNYKGAETSMGNGKAYAWVNTDNFGKPKSIGFTMDAAALDNLPDSAMCQSMMDMASFELELPRESFRTPFEQIVINWNPVGHPPTTIYGLPHFDFHFYTMPSSERLQIPPYVNDSIKFKNAPSSEYFPSGYFCPGGGEAEMGAHWIDINAAELNGSPFTETFVYGSYNGKINFIEPMITYNFFQNISDFSRDIPRPAKVQMNGYYPRLLHISKSGGQYIFSLEKMEYRTAE